VSSVGGFVELLRQVAEGYHPFPNLKPAWGLPYCLAPLEMTNYEASHYVPLEMKLGVEKIAAAV
jgi:hypothetical protein